MATAYFNWITACEQLRIAREQLEIQRGTLTIAEKRHTAGFAPRLDVEQATSSVAATESHIPALIAQVASAKNQLSVLQFWLDPCGFLSAAQQVARQWPLHLGLHKAADLSGTVLSGEACSMEMSFPWA